jgi:hypothetical protein
MNKWHRLVLLFLTLVFAFSCSQPNSPPVAGKASTGALSIELSHMADWLALYAKSQSKALLYATSVKVTIQNSSNVDVIAPAIIAISANNAGSGTATVPTVNSIPTGTGYKVTVSVYNSATSAIDPVVVGTKTSVSITKDATTNITLVCTPPTTTTIAAGSGPFNLAVAQDAEAWYKIHFLSGSQYTISQGTAGIGTFLFLPAGDYVATIGGTAYVYDCATTGDYYIGLAGTTAGTSALDVTVYTPPKNEGSIGTPVALVPDTAHTFMIGMNGSSQNYSYYSFTTGTPGTYFLDSELTASTLLSVYLYSDPSYTTLLTSAFSVPYGASLGPLAATTTYYLKLQDGSSVYDYSFTGKIVSPTAAAADFGGEGTPSSPITVSVGTSHSGGVGKHSYDSKSYYSFTTGAGQDYAIACTGTGSSEKYLAIYSNSGMSTLVASYYFSSNIPRSIVLSPNTQYYFTVSNDEMASDAALSYSILIQAITVTPVGIPISSLTAGTLTASTQVIWYEVPVTAGASYAFYLFDSQASGGSYTLDAYAYLYLSDRMTPCGETDAASTTPRSVSIPASNTKLYIKVVPWNSSGQNGTFAIRVDPSNGSLAMTIR